MEPGEEYLATGWMEEILEGIQRNRLVVVPDSIQRFLGKTSEELGNTISELVLLGFEWVDKSEKTPSGWRVHYGAMTHENGSQRWLEKSEFLQE